MNIDHIFVVGYLLYIACYDYQLVRQLVNVDKFWRKNK